MSSGANGRAEEDGSQFSAADKTLKEGVRVLASTRRPDGTLRKEIRIRPGYTPPDEVPKYQSKGALLKKEMASMLPPGYDPVAVETKAKSKSAKRNERKKEKRQQAALEKDSEQNDISPSEDSVDLTENVKSVASKMNGLTLSGNTSSVAPPSNLTDNSTPGDQVQELEKKIRALKKKIRLTEAQQQKTSEKDMKPEQLEKLSKLEGWHSELKLLEDKKAKLTAGS